MPKSNPGVFDDQTYLDLIAYILRMNGYDVGNKELVPDRPGRNPHGNGELGPGREPAYPRFKLNSALSSIRCQPGISTVAAWQSV